MKVDEMGILMCVSPHKIHLHCNIPHCLLISVFITCLQLIKRDILLPKILFFHNHQMCKIWTVAYLWFFVILIGNFLFLEVGLWVFANIKLVLPVFFSRFIYFFISLASIIFFNEFIFRMCDFTCVLFTTQFCNVEGPQCGFMGQVKISCDHRGFSINWLIPDQEFRGEKQLSGGESLAVLLFLTLIWFLVTLRGDMDLGWRENVAI